MQIFTCYRFENGQWVALSDHQMETIKGLASIAEQLVAFACLGNISIRLEMK